MALSQDWVQRLNALDFAFQPIVNIRTGVSFGYEALLRNHQAAGFETIDHVFDSACDGQVMHQVDLNLREKAITKMRHLPWHELITLFYNIDNRIWDSKDYVFANSVAVLNKLDFPLERICYEISEKKPITKMEFFKNIRHMTQKGSRVAVDDCGAGFSGLQMMYHVEPDFVKIDRFFIVELNKNPKKKLFVSSIVNIAHQIGSLVIAEGVESEEEAHTCIDLGCDLLQGYWIERPKTDMSALKYEYDHIKEFFKKHKRHSGKGDEKFVTNQMKTTLPIHMDMKLIDILEEFKTETECRFLPVVNKYQAPIGIISENRLKPLAFSRYGSSYAQNPSAEKEKYKFIEKCPVADIHTPLDDLLKLYLQDETAKAILLVDNDRYCGFLDDKEIVKAINQRNLAEARDQNPLTQLPGNTKISEYISTALQKTGHDFFIAYLDIENFKAYNDYYGFRQGDRVIKLIADILRIMAVMHGCFSGHIGGDDFFVGMKDIPSDAVNDIITECLIKFEQDVKSFYKPEDIQKGYILSADRNGVIQKYGMLTASAVVLSLKQGRKLVYTMNEISRLFADSKKQVKKDLQRAITVAVE